MTDKTKKKVKVTIPSFQVELDLEEVLSGDPVVDSPVEPTPDPVVNEPAPTEPVEPLVVEEPEPTPSNPVVVKPVFTDAPESGWRDYSWGGKETVAGYEGTAQKVVGTGWNAFNLNYNSLYGIDTYHYEGVEVWLKADGDGTQLYALELSRNQTIIARQLLNDLFADKKLPTEWTKVFVSFKDMGAEFVSFSNIMIKSFKSGAQAGLAIDNLSFVERASAPVPILDANPLPPSDGWLKVSGNKILDGYGNVWQGRGVNIMDCRSCGACVWNDYDLQELKRRADFAMTEMGVNFFRLCLESYGAPQAGGKGLSLLYDEKYFQVIKDYVKYLTDKDAYVMVSVWKDNSTSMADTPTKSTQYLWKKIASAFKDVGRVIFGCVNEPTGNYSGAQNKAVRDSFQECVNAIREVAPKNLIAVQGTGGWSRFVSYYQQDPIVDDNVCYGVHFYNPASDIPNLLGPASKIPVIVEELGPFDTAAGKMTMDDCVTVMDYCNTNDIPWTAWTFHGRCPPNILQDTSGGGCGKDMLLQLTDWGNLVKQKINS